jgi:lambda family phage portal protein
MNVVDHAVGFFFPHLGVRRAHYREVLRSYDAAAIGRRRSSFSARGGSANMALGRALATLRDRARNEVRNTPHGHAIVDVMVRHVVGTGITPIWRTGSDRLDNVVSGLWEEQVQRSDIEGENHFYGQQELAVRSMVEGGETISRYIEIPLTEDRRTPCRLQLLEGDHIDTSRDGTFEGRRVRLGVALGKWAKREGYYLFPEHPGDLYATAASRFVSRSETRLLYRPMRIGQVRGITWLAPLLMPAKDLHDLLRNTITKTAVEAAFSGFVTNTADTASPLPFTINSAGEREMLPEPGMLVELRPGQDIKFAQPTTSTQFDPIAVHTLQAMAIGAGLTYDQVTGDLRRANYSSLRAGKIEHRRLVEMVQFNTVIPRFCEPFAERFIDRCIMAGTLRPRADGYPHDWVPPANEPIDPKKDLEADISAVRAGRMSPQEFISQWGRDWRKVVNDTAAFFAVVDAKKLALEIDARRPRNGAAAAAPAEPAEQDDDTEVDDEKPPADDDAEEE